jgi:hypothetical protein
MREAKGEGNMKGRTKTEGVKYFLAAILGACMLTLCKGDVKAATVYESEDNNSYEAANGISLGDSVGGNQSDSGDVDYYKVIPENNGKITIDFKHTYEDNWKGWNILLVHYADGSYVELSSTNVSLSDNEKITLPFIGAKKGEAYYIVVTCRDNNSYAYTAADYTISTSFDASEYIEREGNDSYSAATAIGLGKSCAGVLNDSSDKDYYLVRPDADGKITVDFKHTYEDNWKGWNISLVHYADGSYVELSSSNVSLSGNEKITFPFIGAKKGEAYYIVVTCRDNNSYAYTAADYTISTSFKKTAYAEKEENDTYAAATTIKANKTYTGIMNSSSDKDNYKIVAPETGTLSFKFAFPYEDGSYYWYVYIYQYANGEYKQLESTHIYQNSADTKVNIAKVDVKKNGIYYIVVEEGYEVHSGTDEYKIIATYSAKPKATTITGTSAKTDRVTLTWKKQTKQVTGYQIQYATNSKFTKNKTSVLVKSAKKSSETITGLSGKTTYYFRIRTYKTVSGKKYYSEWSKVQTVKTK